MSRWALILLAGLATACATECPSGSPCYGRPIEREQVLAIEAGVTTAEDISRSLGEPTDLHIAEDGSETWVYRYRSTLHDHPDHPCGALLYVPVLGLLLCTQSQTEAELRVDFDPRGVVRDQNFAIREQPFPPRPPPPIYNLGDTSERRLTPRPASRAG